MTWNAKRVAHRKGTIPLEHQEQKSLFDWLEIAKRRWPDLVLAFAVPNGARTSISVAKRLKAEGLRAGVPDVVLPVPRGGFHGLFIEMKRLKGGTVSIEQKLWHNSLRDQGYKVAVCRGCQEATEEFKTYIELPR